MDWGQDEIQERIRKLDSEQLNIMVQSTRVYWVQLMKGQLLMLPPGSLVVEKSVNKAVSYGMKTPFLSHSCHADMWLQTWKHMKDVSRHPHHAQMMSVLNFYSKS